MDANKRLILFEVGNLLTKIKGGGTQESIAKRMVEKCPGLGSIEKAMPLVLMPHTDFCAYSSAQAQKKLAAALNAVAPVTWDEVVEANIAATTDMALNEDVIEMISIIQQQYPSIKVGVFANGFWYSTPIIKAALPVGMFDLFFQSGDLRCRKPWQQAYEVVENITDISGINILLYDNDYKNVLEAREHRWTAELVNADSPIELLREIAAQFLGCRAEDIAPVEPRPTDTIPSPVPVAETAGESSADCAAAPDKKPKK